MFMASKFLPTLAIYPGRNAISLAEIILPSIFPINSINPSYFSAILRMFANASTSLDLQWHREFFFSQVETGEPNRITPSLTLRLPGRVFSRSVKLSGAQPPAVRFAGVWFSARWEIRRWRYPKRFPKLPPASRIGEGMWRMSLRWF